MGPGSLRTLPGLCAAVVAAAALAGCGAGGSGDGTTAGPTTEGSDEQQIATTAEDFWAAVEDGDGETACSLMASAELVGSSGDTAVQHVGQDLFVDAIAGADAKQSDLFPTCPRTRPAATPSPPSPITSPTTRSPPIR